MSPTGELKFRDITDGTSTRSCFEAPEAKAVQWTKPDDISINADSPLNGLLDNTRQGFNVVLADGAVRFLSNQIDPEIWRCSPAMVRKSLTISRPPVCRKLHTGLSTLVCSMHWFSQCWAVS